MAVLIGMSSEVKGCNYEIARDKVTIGRNATNLIVIEHATVSGSHCCIHREGKRYSIVDLGSTNGTRVNSEEITEAPLSAKDLVQVGSVEFMFDSEDEATTDSHAHARAPITVSNKPASTPISFGSISPFGPRRKENMALWYTLIIVVGLLALAGVGIVVFKLLLAS